MMKNRSRRKGVTARRASRDWIYEVSYVAENCDDEGTEG